MTTYFQGAPVRINTANVLSGIQDADYQPNISMLKPVTDGRAVRTIATIGREAPAVAITTLNILQILGLMTLTDAVPWLALTDLAWYGLQADPNAPKHATGSVHEMARATSGTLFMAGLESAANEPAVMSLIAALTCSDGVTHPVTFTQVTQPADPLTIAACVLDSVTIDGTNIDEVISVGVQPSVGLQTEFGAKPYPRLARVRDVDWVMTVRHNAAALERTKTDKVASISATWKLLNTGGPTRGTTGFTIAVAGALVQGGSSRRGNENAEFTHHVHGRHDGTNMPATITLF